MGVTQHHMGSDTSTAISNLLLVTGNFGRPGTGAYPLRGHNNVQGCSDFGTINSFYPGYQPVQDEQVRDRFAKSWGRELPLEPGLDNHEMVDAAHEGSSPWTEARSTKSRIRLSVHSLPVAWQCSS